MKKFKLLSIILTLALLISATSMLFITASAEETPVYDFSSITTEAQLNTITSKITLDLNNGVTNIVLNYGDKYSIYPNTNSEIYFNDKVNSAIKNSSAADGSIDLTINGEYAGNVWKSLGENLKLETVRLPDSILLASDLFKNSSNLTYVYAPKAYHIGNNVFKGCDSLNIVILTTPNAFSYFETAWEPTFGESSTNVTIALNCNKISEVSGNTWKTQTFKSIAYSHNSVTCKAYGTAGDSIEGTCIKCNQSVFILTLKAPENLVYSDSSKEATVTSTLEGMALPEITYKKGNTVLSAPPTDVGTYTASITLGSASASVSFTIQKKALTVTAEDITVCVDGDFEFSYITNGFEGDDTFITEPTLSCDDDTTAIGEYVINISGATASENYDIKYVNGTLTVQNHSYDELEHFDVDMHKKVCDCGDFIYEDHEWDKGEITKPATCAEEGEKLFTCTICNDTTTESIPMLNHTDEDNDSKCDDCSDDISDTNDSSDDTSNNDENSSNDNNKEDNNANDNQNNESNDENSNANSTDNANGSNSNGETEDKNANGENDNNGEADKNGENSSNDDEENKKRGCGGCNGCRSSASISAIAIISVISMAAVIKKKED